MSEIPTQSTDLQISVDHEVPVLKKILTWLTIWFWVENIRRIFTERSVEIRLSAELL